MKIIDIINLANQNIIVPGRTRIALTDPSNKKIFQYAAGSAWRYGNKGTIIEIIGDLDFPYRVELDNGEMGVLSRDEFDIL